MKRRRRGMALAVVLSLVTLLILIALSVATTGVATLNLTGANQRSQQSMYAAEAGLAASFREIIQGTAGWTGYSNVVYGDCTYSVQATAGPQPASAEHPAIPANTVYLLATGKSRGKYPRRVACLIAGGAAASPAAAFNYAIASAQRIDLSGGGTIGGSIKASEDIQISGGVRIQPLNGDGRMLAGEDIEIGMGVRRDPSQDMRARQRIQIGSRDQTTNAEAQIFPGDTTPASAPFINDGRITNTLNAGEVGEVLPNPDPQILLGLQPDGAGGYLRDASGNYVVDSSRVVLHSSSREQYSGSTNFDLGDKIHFFPGGVEFSGSTNFVGKGTIVSAERIDFSGSTGGSGGPAQVNLLALSLPGSGGNARIKFSGSTNLQGLVLAHERVETSGNFRLDGMVVSYRERFDSSGNRRITFNSAALNVPGLESWLVPVSGGSGPGTLGIPPGRPIRVLWWQRL